MKRVARCCLCSSSEHLLSSQEEKVGISRTTESLSLCWSRRVRKGNADVSNKKSHEWRKEESMIFLGCQAVLYLPTYLQCVRHLSSELSSSPISARFFYSMESEANKGFSFGKKGNRCNRNFIASFGLLSEVDRYLYHKMEFLCVMQGRRMIVISVPATITEVCSS